MSKRREILELSDGDAQAKLAELKTELAKERGHIASGTRPDNPGKIRVLRKNIARILTIQHTKMSSKKNEVSKSK